MPATALGDSRKETRMTPQIKKRATLTHPHRPPQELHLMQIERGVFRWVTISAADRSFGPDYLTETDAIRGIRAEVESNPDMVGVDLTVFPVAPPPEVRAAKAIRDARNDVNPLFDVDMVAEIIRKETGIDGLLEHYQAMLAFLFQRRRAYAAALFPKVDGMEPRDITLDGLLLNCIEATEKSVGQGMDNLKAILNQPVSRIIKVGGGPQNPGKVN